VGSIHQSQGRYQWRAFVKTTVNLRVIKKLGIYRVFEQLLTCQEGLRPMELVRACVGHNNIFVAQYNSLFFNAAVTTVPLLLKCNRGERSKIATCT
jgi:hypothetical protein